MKKVIIVIGLIIASLSLYTLQVARADVFPPSGITGTTSPTGAGSGYTLPFLNASGTPLYIPYSQATSSAFAVTGLVSCNTIDTTADGDLICGSDDSGGSATLGITFENRDWQVSTLGGGLYVQPTTTITVFANNGFVSNASSTINSTLEVSSSFGASSTAMIDGLSTLTGFISTASSTILGDVIIGGDVTTTKVGIGTSSPTGALGITGDTTMTNSISLPSVVNLQSGTAVSGGGQNWLSFYDSATANPLVRFFSDTNRDFYITGNPSEAFRDIHIDPTEIIYLDGTAYVSGDFRLSGGSGNGKIETWPSNPQDTAMIVIAPQTTNSFVFGSLPLKFGIGTSTASTINTGIHFWNDAIASTSQPIFTISDHASSTLFLIDDGGTVSVGDHIIVGTQHSDTPSTFSGGLISSASSTILGDFFITGGATSTNGLGVTNLTDCDTIDTDSSGNFKCGTDGGGGGSATVTASLEKEGSLVPDTVGISLPLSTASSTQQYTPGNAFWTTPTMTTNSIVHDAFANSNSTTTVSTARFFAGDDLATSQNARLYLGAMASTTVASSTPIDVYAYVETFSSSTPASLDVGFSSFTNIVSSTTESDTLTLSATAFAPVWKEYSLSPITITNNSFVNFVIVVWRPDTGAGTNGEVYQQDDIYFLDPKVLVEKTLQ